MLEIQAKTKAKKRSKKAKKRRKKGVDVEDDPNILTQEILSINYKKFLDELEIEQLANSKKELEQREKNVKDLELYIERAEALERKRNIRNILSKKAKSFIDKYKDIQKNIQKNKQQINNNKVALNNLIDNKLVDVIRLMENLVEKNICEDFVYLLTEMIYIEIKKIKLELEEDYLENKSKIQEYELKIYNILKGNIEEVNKFPEFKFKFKDWTELINSKNWNKLINLIDSFVLILYLFLEVIDYHNNILESALVDNKIQLLREFLTFNIHQEEKISLVLFISLIVKRAMIQILFESDETLKSKNSEESINNHNYHILMMLKFVAKKDKMIFYNWVNKHYRLLSEKSFVYANAIDIRKRTKSIKLENFRRYRSKNREAIYKAEIVSHTIIELDDSSNLNKYVVLIDNAVGKYIDIVYHNEKIFKVSEVVDLIYRRTGKGEFIFEIISKPAEELEIVNENLDGIYKNRPKEYL